MELKKRFQLFLTLSMVLVSLIANAQNTTPKGIYKSVNDEVSLEVQRGTGEVNLLIQVKNISQYHHIVIERSAENPNYFGKCKYISCTNLRVTDGKISTTDKYPYSATKNVYYRIKTISNDGVERAYPALLLPALVE